MGRHVQTLALPPAICFEFRHLKYKRSFTFDSKEPPWPSILQQPDINRSSGALG